MSGTKLPAVILDISRTVSRLSNANSTGIDRVELAYIQYFLTWPSDVYFLARFRRQAAFLDRAGMVGILEMVSENRDWAPLDLIGRLSRNKRAARVESNLRRAAICWPSLKNGISKIEFTAGIYLNVGHGKLMPKLWNTLKDIPAKKICMVHDVIPLDFPEFCSDKTRSRFESEFVAAARNADYLIWNSNDTKDRALHWLSNFDVIPPPSSTIGLGTDIAIAPKSSPAIPPYFVVVGTIEPRKNHALLLDIWRDFYAQHGDKSATLHIVGGRGWMNADVFEALDTAPFMGKTVIEHGYLPDEALSNLIDGASGLLFPSFAEGFGFPLIDAIVRNVPVVCSDLPAFKEIGKTYPIYADPKNKQIWIDAIDNLSTNQGQNEFINRKKPDIITWDKHFSQLSSILSCLS